MSDKTDIGERLRYQADRALAFAAEAKLQDNLWSERWAAALTEAYSHNTEAADLIASQEAEIASLRAERDALEGALKDQCLAAEYWAGCAEGCDPDTASSEIMSSGGAWPAQAYDKAMSILEAHDGE